MALAQRPVSLETARRTNAMVRALKLVLRNVKYGFVMLLVSLCYVAYLKSPTKSTENDIEKKFESEPARSSKTQWTPESLATTVAGSPIERSGRGPITATPIRQLASVGMPSADPNKTLDWLDLWANDTVCNKLSVHLLEDNSVEPRTLVSFPGSGNTWLRMLLMGLTGIYIDTVYPGDEKFPTKGKFQAVSTHVALRNCQVVVYILPRCNCTE